jgi:hypothetical protein
MMRNVCGLIHSGFIKGLALNIIGFGQRFHTRHLKHDRRNIAELRYKVVGNDVM